MNKKEIKKRNRRADYEKRRNIMNNNVPKRFRFLITAGDGILKKSTRLVQFLNKKNVKEKKEKSIF